MLEYLKEANKQKKTVIFTADTYLPSQFFESLFIIREISGYQGIYVSNEMKAAKWNGKMQELLAKKFDLPLSAFLFIEEF